jgi:phage/plasmid-associated DNA primase
LDSGGGGPTEIALREWGAEAGKLPCKLLLISNERPRIRDKSGAVAIRMINRTTRVSFYDREDRHLFRNKLRPELPGIALWALEGLRLIYLLETRIQASNELYAPHSSGVTQ